MQEIPSTSSSRQRSGPTFRSCCMPTSKSMPADAALQVVGPSATRHCWMASGNSRSPPSSRSRAMQASTQRPYRSCWRKRPATLKTCWPPDSGVVSLTLSTKPIGYRSWRHRDGQTRYAAPRRVVAEGNDRLAHLLPLAFPPRYLDRRLYRSYPAPSLSVRAREFVATREAAARGSRRIGIDAALIGALLMPGQEEPWPEGPQAMDEGFAALVEVLDLLTTIRPDVDLTDVLANPRAAFIPVLADAPGGRRLRGPVITGERDSDADAAWILARPGKSATDQITPPAFLGLDFLADGVLDERAITRARFLGICEYRSETVLDAVATGGWRPEEGPDVTRFAFQLLARDRGSTFRCLAPFKRPESLSLADGSGASRASVERRTVTNFAALEG